MRLLNALAVAVLIAPLAASAPDAGGSVSKGGTTGGEQQGGGSGGKQDEKWDDSLIEKSKKVKPGESHTNGDGVTVENNSDKSGEDIRVTPAKGDADSATTVHTDSGVEGTISGIDSNDTVNLGSSNTVTVSGTGGTVNVSGNTTVTVTNVAGTGSVNMSIVTSGGTITLAPGNSFTFSS